MQPCRAQNDAGVESRSSFLKGKSHRTSCCFNVNHAHAHVHTEKAGGKADRWALLSLKSPVKPADTSVSICSDRANQFVEFFSDEKIISTNSTEETLKKIALPHRQDSSFVGRREVFFLIQHSTPKNLWLKNKLSFCAEQDSNLKRRGAGNSSEKCSSLFLARVREECWGSTWTLYLCVFVCVFLPLSAAEGITDWSGSFTALCEAS